MCEQDTLTSRSNPIIFIAFQYLGTSSSHRLSEMMPDIAMATSALAEIHLYKEPEELVNDQTNQAGSSLDEVLVQRVTYLQ